MGELAKKQKAKSKKQTSSKRSESVDIKSIRDKLSVTSGGLKKKANISLNRLTTTVQNIPSWVKGLPAAIRNRMQEDKKKKKYRSFRLQKKIKPEPRYIPTSFGLIKASFKFLYAHKKVFLAIILIHAVLYATIIRSPVTTDIGTIEESVKSILGDKNDIQSNVATLGAVIGTSGSGQTNPTAVSASIVLMSLVYIWAIRQLHAGKTIKARDAYYQGMAPLASGVIVLCVASLQLIPFAVASIVYSTARSGGLFVTGFEDLAAFIITILTALLSFYWMTSTVIGLYIVTLPGMYPLQALRSAKKLVQFQRFPVFRRIVALPVILSLLYAGLLLIFIRFASSQVFLIAEILQLLILPLIHIYFYKLYRALI